MSILRRIKFQLSKINEKIPKDSKGQCLSATILRAAGPGVRHEVAEMFCRFDRLKIHAASNVQKVKQRTEKEIAAIEDRLERIKKSAIQEVEEAVTLYKTIDEDQARWVNRHDWQTYQHGVNMQSFMPDQRSISKVKKLPDLYDRSLSNTQKKSAKNNTVAKKNTVDLSLVGACAVARKSRRLTRSLKALPIIQSAEKILGQIKSKCDEANDIVVQKNTGLPSKKQLQWADNQVQFNKDPKNAYTTTYQVMVNIAVEFEERGVKLPPKHKQQARVQQIRKWLKVYRSKGIIRGRGKPKDSTTKTGDVTIEAIEKNAEETGFATQVRSLTSKTQTLTNANPFVRRKCKW